MKAKIKTKLVYDGYAQYLKIYIKLEQQWFYRDYTICNSWRNKSFNDDVIEFLSDINNIKIKGEEIVRKQIIDNIEMLKKSDKAKKIQELLKQFKQPIEIEVKL